MRISKSLGPTSARSILVAAVLLLMAYAISAQISAGTKPIYPIEFKPGTHTKVVKGTIARPMTPERQSDGSEKYTLQAQAGQFLKVEISSNNHQAVFSILQTSPAAVKNELIKNASRVKRWSGTLTKSSNYTIIVLTPDPDGYSRFKLRITLR